MLLPLPLPLPATATAATSGTSSGTSALHGSELRVEGAEFGVQAKAIKAAAYWLIGWLMGLSAATQFGTQQNVHGRSAMLPVPVPPPQYLAPQMPLQFVQPRPRFVSTERWFVGTEHLLKTSPLPTPSPALMRFTESTC